MLYHSLYIYFFLNLLTLYCRHPILLCINTFTYIYFLRTRKFSYITTVKLPNAGNLTMMQYSYLKKKSTLQNFIIALVVFLRIAFSQSGFWSQWHIAFNCYISSMRKFNIQPFFVLLDLAIFWRVQVSWVLLLLFSLVRVKNLPQTVAPW